MFTFDGLIVNFGGHQMRLSGDVEFVEEFANPHNVMAGCLIVEKQAAFLAALSHKTTADDKEFQVLPKPETAKPVEKVVEKPVEAPKKTDLKKKK